MRALGRKIKTKYYSRISTLRIQKISTNHGENIMIGQNENGGFNGFSKLFTLKLS